LSSVATRVSRAKNKQKAIFESYVGNKFAPELTGKPAPKAESRKLIVYLKSKLKN